MDLNKMILLKGEPNDDIVNCYDCKHIQRQAVTFKSGKTYNYTYDNVVFLDKPVIIDKDLYKFTNSNGDTIKEINKILMFKNSYGTYFRLFFNSSSHKSYNGRDLKMHKNSLVNSEIKNIFNYYKCVSQKVGLKADDGTNILNSQFEKMSFISEKSILSKFLGASEIKVKKSEDNRVVIFPFGCNLSQISAVENAITNKASVIEGPPGTGKTQTILNIVANILMNGETVAVVSNNNAATDNVFEKLQKYGFEYIAAPLGNSGNKDDFIMKGQLVYPSFSRDTIRKDDKNVILNDISNLKSQLIKMYKNQNSIAELNSDLTKLKTEKNYFDEYFVSIYNDIQIFRDEVNISSEKVLYFWRECQEGLEGNRKIGIWFKLKSMLFYGIKDFNVYNQGINNIIALVQKKFYELKITEINNEIERLQNLLDEFTFKEKIDELTNKSTILFRNLLAKKYKIRRPRVKFDKDIFWKNPDEFIFEYPVILSTTHSVKNTLRGFTYDYIIVDESSQVDLLTGVLAMACTKNIVIVGDLKQLPNVIARQDKINISDISNSLNIPYKYRYEENSLLSSICQVVPNIPRTLLREHYRCHPKIIDFCNQKFYNNELLIMTRDNGEEDVLKVYVTSKGSHARGHINQRQIDEIKRNILPELSSNDVGIISPYKDQASALVKELQNDLDISTVHKFQGREKDDIIISTVDNEISDFTDNLNMLNVSVSRAKNRLRIVISDNDKNENTNIGDLVKYTKYNNFEIRKSDIFSVFDMLYKCYEKSKIEYLSRYKRVSEFDSENLMYALIKEVLNTDKFSNMDALTHHPIKYIIRNTHKLSEDELKYAMNGLTHLDFLIYNKMDKHPILGVEVDGYSFHKDGTRQKQRDDMKDAILEKYGIEVIRFNTTGSMEKERLIAKLNALIKRY